MLIQALGNSLAGLHRELPIIHLIIKNFLHSSDPSVSVHMRHNYSQILGPFRELHSHTSSTNLITSLPVLFHLKSSTTAPYMSVNPHISPLYFLEKWADSKFTNVLTVRISLSPLYSRAASQRDYSIAAIHFYVVPAHSVEPFIRLQSFSPVTRL